jgi:hypothetical protein
VAEDRVGPDTLSPYPTVVLPGCTFLTLNQGEQLLAYLDGGGRAVVIGELGTNLPDQLRSRLLDHTSLVGTQTGELVRALPEGPQVQVSGDVAVNIHRLADGSAAVHLVNYGYDVELDRVEGLKDVELSVRLPLAEPTATVVAPGGASTGLSVRSEQGVHHMLLDRLDLYAIVVLSPGAADPKQTGAPR